MYVLSLSLFIERGTPSFSLDACKPRESGGPDLLFHPSLGRKKGNKKTEYILH